MARFLKHNQPDPLPIKPLSEDRVDYFWNMLQQNLNTFDDYTPFDRDEFEFCLFGQGCESYEIGDGVGLTTIIYNMPNSYIQMIMFDWKLRDDVCERIFQMAFDAGAERVTATVSDDRGQARELVTRFGFKKEGNLRQAFLRQGISTYNMAPYHDVEIWGILREEWQQR